MLIGSGPIVIGQACEFDYSGTQACKALAEEGYDIVLVNSNPATIMTDPEVAHRTYIEPITPEICARIIAAESRRPCCQRSAAKPRSTRRWPWLKAEPSPRHQGRDDWRATRRDQDGRRPRAFQSRHGPGRVGHATRSFCHSLEEARSTKLNWATRRSSVPLYAGALAVAWRTTPRNSSGS